MFTAHHSTDPRMAGPMPQRHQSLSEFDHMGRPHSASNAQGYYANQRFAPRPNEAEQVMQAKRRMAAQRERELRNYHQEQQYNRSKLFNYLYTYITNGSLEVNTFGKPEERVVSPGNMSEDARRELIASQHRALYNPDGSAFVEDPNAPRAVSQAPGSLLTMTSAPGGGRGASPLAFDPFGMGQNGQSNQAPQSATEQSHQGTGNGPSPIQQRSRANSASSPSAKSANFSLFEQQGANQQSSRTSASSPGGSPPRQGSRSSTTPTGGVAPIGTRPNQNSQGQAPNPALNKRSTTPLPSPLSYGFAANEENKGNNGNEDKSSNAIGSEQQQSAGVGLGWGNKSGVWGNKTSLAPSASVWG
jgi:hypothetical protein